MLQYIANGLVVGSIIALSAVGLTLTYGILKLTNFAHGDVVTLGAYVLVFANLTLGISPWLGLPIAAAVGAGVSILLEVLVWRKLRKLGASTVSQLVASIGVALMLRNLILFFFGGGLQRLKLPIQRAQPVLGLPVELTSNQQYVIIGAIVAAIGVHLILRYTSVGKAMRALSDNMELAWVSGIDVDRVIVWTWVLGGGLAATGGMLYGLIVPVHTNLGWFLLLPIFAGVILGGIGSPYGAIAGGFIVGLAQELSVYVGVPNEYKLAVSFILLMLVLFVFPRGLFGERALS